MTKKFILNLLINLGIVFLILSGVAAYNSGNMLILGASIAFMVVLIYLKVVLLKMVNKEVRQQNQPKEPIKQKQTKK
ncbi:DUF6358 family protein [Sphingobacterium hungaricum]|uniref:Sortase n=1 Tax=Sphingobacterium hungaricum TaxID=2082723 RepID=A0A928YPW2_9SPHI|nr:DUF6358 family protein [Sphingobacterium hungaricum]MBE8712977.1 sortase [Sphingobacterium hungaricum]